MSEDQNEFSSQLAGINDRLVHLSQEEELSSSLRSVVTQVQHELHFPHARYKVPLAELVSKIVSTNEPEFHSLQEAVRNNFQVANELQNLIHVEDWDKALNDEANFQFSSKYRPVVEAILNGIDSQQRKEAKEETYIPDKRVDVSFTDRGFVVKDQGEGMNLETVLEKLLVPKLTGNEVNKTDVVGRFGVGFYSLLGFLKEKNDHVSVLTSDGKEGYRVSISRYFGEDVSQQGRLSVVISKLNPQEQERIGRGTEIEVRTKGFDKQAAETYVKDSLQFKPDSSIYVNGEVINKYDDFHVTETYIQDEAKTRTVRLIESKERGSHSRVIVTVGGVKVEEFDAKGLQVPNTLVLDLPTSVSLPKSRDAIQVNEHLVHVMKKSLDMVFQNGFSPNTVAAYISSLTPVITEFQERNPKPHIDQNLVHDFRTQIAAWREKLPKTFSVIPFSPDLSRLDFDNCIALPDTMMLKKSEVVGRNKDTSFNSFNRESLYWLPFQTDDLIAVTEGYLFLNEKYQTEDPKMKALYNALFDIYNKSRREGERQIEGVFKPDETNDATETLPDYKRPRSLIEPLYSYDIDVSSADKQAYYDAIWRDEQEQIEKRIKFIDDLQPHPVARSPIANINGQVMGKDYDVRGDETNANVDVDFSPESLEQMHEWWLKDKLAFYISSHMEPRLDATFSSASDLSTPISKDTGFWQRVLTENFYKQARHLVTLPMEQAFDNVLSQLPEQTEASIRTRYAGKLDNLIHNYNRIDLINSLTDLVAEDYSGDENKVEITQVVLLAELINSMYEEKEIFGDDELLKLFCKGGEFSKEIGNIFAGQGIHEKGKVGFGNFGFYTVDREREMNFDYDDDDNDLITFSDFQSRRTIFNDGGNLSYVRKLDSFENKHAFLEWYFKNIKRIQPINNELQLNDSKKPKIYFSQNENIYTSLYKADIRTDEDFQMFENNFRLIQSLFEDESSRQLFFETFSMSTNLFSGPSLESLMAGPINKDNLEIIRSSLENNFSNKDQKKLKYLNSVLSYAYLDTDIFQTLNASLLKSGHEIPYHFAYMDTPETVMERVTFLENLPEDYRDAYYSLHAQLLGKPYHMHKSFNEYKTEHIVAQTRILNTLSRISEFPKKEASILLHIFDIKQFTQRDELIQMLHDGDFDRDIYPWYVYLLQEGKPLPRVTSRNEMASIHRKIHVRGSTLVGKYFTSSELSEVRNFDGLHHELSSTDDRSRAVAVGQRRIEHAVNYQSSERYIWLRELVQNAYNATRNTEQKQVEISNYMEGNMLAISVTDTAGMDLNKVINSLLVPQKSDWESKDSIGYFGQGFFTIFKNADEVRIKTSLGDGQVTYVTVRPIRHGDKVVDLSFEIGQKNESFKGTSITWMKETDFEDFDAAQAKSHLISYAGLMPEDALAIHWNGEKINKDVEKLSGVQTEFGEIKMYKIPDESSVTQNGLYIRNLDSEYTSLIPNSVRRLLEKQHIALDLPPSIRLIDSRSDIAQKEEVLPKLRAAIAEASIRSALQLFLTSEVDFENLPYDFFTKAKQYNPTADALIEQDSEALMEGRGVSDIDIYMNNDTKMLQLLLSIPSVVIDGHKLSIHEAILAAEQNPEIMKKLPLGLHIKMTEERSHLHEVDKKLQTRFEAEGFAEVEDITHTELPPEYDSYLAFMALTSLILRPMIHKSGMRYFPTYYSSPEFSLAHAISRIKMIGWNLTGINEYVKTLSEMLQGHTVSERNTMNLYESVGNVATHEFQHILENTDESMTHNKTFFDSQLKLLEYTIKNIDINNIEQQLRTAFGGTFIPAAEYSQILAQRVTEAV